MNYSLVAKSLIYLSLKSSSSFIRPVQHEGVARAMAPYLHHLGYSYGKTQLEPRPFKFDDAFKASSFKLQACSGCLSGFQRLQIPLMVIPLMLCYTTARSFPTHPSSIISSAGGAKVAAVCIDASATSLSSSSRARFCGSSGGNETNLNTVRRKSVRSVNCSVGLGDFGEIGGTYNRFSIKWYP